MSRLPVSEEETRNLKDWVVADAVAANRSPLLFPVIPGKTGESRLFGLNTALKIGYNAVLIQLLSVIYRHSNNRESDF
jgi:hypothetical protein